MKPTPPVLHKCEPDSNGAEAPLGHRPTGSQAGEGPQGSAETGKSLLPQDKPQTRLHPDPKSAEFQGKLNMSVCESDSPGLGN